MLEVTTFLMRWLFVCNLIRDVAEIQTLPPTQFYQNYNPQTEEEWRSHCLRGILSYPPGSTQRLLVMDAIRAELVQKLEHKLRSTDEVLNRHIQACRRYRESKESSSMEEEEKKEEEDPFLDADMEIVRTFGKGTLDDEARDGVHAHQAVLIISKDGTDVAESDEEQPKQNIMEDLPSEQQVEDAHLTNKDIRDYLPQLVSAVLRSPPAFQSNLVDPIQTLRRLVLNRCLEDPNWGIELCWQLEAEVGRSWKTLFEHRQQSGRRLVVVLPAEKAAVLAKIGSDKLHTFDLLQDAEQVTAYGYAMEPALAQHGHPATNGEHQRGFSRLPSSLSLRRCSHFGDTMHFIDRLTEISLRLRTVPADDRLANLHESLEEMNRRLRRRMVTRGDVSLDVEDNRAAHEWPHVSHLTMDMLKYSVHLPLQPETILWPSGGKQTGKGTLDEKSKAGVMRVLNIVVPECRILSSRERCPYLVHLEVAETGLEGNDARLYASGAMGLGATVEEVLGMSTGPAAAAAASWKHQSGIGTPTYSIPYELLPKTTNPRVNEKTISRGGAQTDDGMYSTAPQDFWDSNPYDMIRQDQLEQLHRQMHHQQSMAPTQTTSGETTTSVTNGDLLLEKIYGAPWIEKCEQIRQASPYGNVKGWRLASFIMKAGEDIRREALVMQIISKMNGWFEADIPEQDRPFMRPYTIMCVGGDAGLLECLSDAKSIDEVKKQTDGFTTLRDYFERAYGSPGTPPPPVDGPVSTISFEQAQDNFLRSLVGYSLVCYVLQIKDRHNANILLDREGHVIHIDFGFVLGDTPRMGKVPLFSERAPFKLSTEFWEVLGGWNLNEGGLGVRFCRMFERAFACAAAHTEEIAALVEAAMLTLDPNPRTARLLASGVRSRLRMRGAAGSRDQKMFIMNLVNAALTSWGTSTYDWLQRSMNGYQ